LSMNTSNTWDLDAIFPGGSRSEAFRAFVAELKAGIQALESAVAALHRGSTTDDWAGVIDRMQSLAAKQRQAGAFVSCLNAQNTKDADAKLLEGTVSQTSALLTGALTAFDAKLKTLDADVLQRLLHHPRVAPVRFSIEERIERAVDKLPEPQERLITDLGVDGYQAWGQLYDVIVGRMTMTVEEDGKTVELSMGQAMNRLSHPNRELRKQVFAKWESTWADSAELCAQALNHLAGYRLTAYKHRGWDSVLKEPLQINRMSEQTLRTMWDVISRNKGPFVKYLQRKAKLFGVEKLSWHDVSAPVGDSAKTVTFDQARQFVVENFGKFSSAMAEFADHCFERRWVEAEDRPNKRSGAFCTSFPVSKATRVFMTFSGIPANVSTLAHELGHAYHQHVMRDLPQFAQNYAMNVAETASTFAEAIVVDADIKQAKNKTERIVLLDDKVERSVAMFMNIHARFLFETRFYEERKHGLVSVQRLNELMEQAQREAYCDVLGEYHPHFWASKLHFYITGTPFYNFPYTFGYMFSTGIYARALAEGPTFSDKYVALLRDTASMRVEELARKHLDVDLTQPDFWQSAIDTLRKDVEEFLALTESMSSRA
jgi:oligoendopeptidase F